MESGDFGDNLEIFLNARYQMKTGSHKDGLQTIQTLRRRIIATGEVKSNRWLIPTLDAFLSQNERPELQPIYQGSGYTRFHQINCVAVRLVRLSVKLPAKMKKITRWFRSTEMVKEDLSEFCGVSERRFSGTK